MKEKSNQQSINRDEYLFFLSIGYIYEGPVENGYALRRYDTVSAPIDDYGRKYMMNAINPIFISDKTRVVNRSTNHMVETSSYLKKKQQIKDDLKRLITQYYADEITKEKAKQEHDVWRINALENGAYWLPQKVQEERLSTTEIPNQILNSVECKSYLDVVGNNELWSWDKIGVIRKYKPNWTERLKEEVPIIGNFLYNMGDDFFITLQIIFLQHDRYHLRGNIAEGQEVIEGGIGGLLNLIPYTRLSKISGIAVKPMNVSQWQKSLIFSKKIIDNKIKKIMFTKHVKRDEIKFMYNQYKNTIYENNSLLKDLKLIEGVDKGNSVLNSIRIEYEETK